MLLIVLFACPSQSTPTAASSGDAWPDWTPASDTAAESESPALDSADLPPEGEVDECEPGSCIELAEAVDRGYATIEYTGVGVRVQNAGPYPVCIDGWYTFLSPTSQDAVAGSTGSDEIDPGDRYVFPYGEWGVDAPAWWCIEHNQYTANGASYTFEGERAPSRIGNWANNASDEDADGTEDHNDPHPDDRLPQTQHNNWDYLADDSVFIVGRRMNWFQVEGRQSVEVILEVTNLGRDSGSAQVAERLPPEWVVSSTSPEAARADTGTDGSTTLGWTVSLDAAVEPSNTANPTIYDVAELHYVLTYTGVCHGREIGNAPMVSWVDYTGAGWTSQGSPLVLQCCGGDDSVVGGSGGIGP